MKKRGRISFILGIFVLILVLLGVVFKADLFGGVTGGVVEGINGNVIGAPGGDPGSAFAGIPEEEQRCMQSCVEEGCEGKDMQCMMGNRERCMTRCGAQPAAQSEGEQCMQNCVDRSCTPGPEYMNCMEQNKNSCEEECDMKGDAPDESEMDAEQLCISNCVAAEDPSIICGNSQEGETGNALCQRCAADCVHLYEGPCLDDAGITEKENECASQCEHCYGSPVEGASGEGWDCIVDVECLDASAEFGDEAGEGPGIGEEGYVAPEEESSEKGFVGGVVKGIKNFFKGIFGR